MKKFSKVLAMVMVALMMMSVVAFAEDAEVAEPISASVEDQVVTVVLTGLTAGEEATILVVNNSVADLSALENGDIVYIDQLTVADDNTVTFTLDASNAEEVDGKKLVDIYCGYTNMDVAEGPRVLADVDINPATTPDIIYGDVNGDGKVTTDDCIVILNKVLGATIEGFNDTAADVNCDAKVTTDDCILILNKVLGADVTLGPSAK